MDFNQWKDMGLDYLQKGKEIALDATEKGKVNVLILNKKAKLYRVQRNLGALVYRIAKGREEDQGLVEQYVDVIAGIEDEIESLKATLTVQEQNEVEELDLALQDVQEPVLDEEMRCCEQCGAQMESHMRFCNKCGKQL